MSRLICLALAAALAKSFPVHAQQKDPPRNFTNGIGMRFVWIPPGTFMMGSPREEADRFEEETQHKVKLTKGFYMSVHLITRKQWETVMEYKLERYGTEKDPPVETVSWNDCREFIKKLRDKDRKPYRLPSEAEWEYACRAGTTTPFHFGETISTDQANYRGDMFPYGKGKIGEFRQHPTTVGSFPPNAWGLFDMHGNVWQWCEDWYGDYPHKDVVDPQGPKNGEFRVLRGGSWDTYPLQCRSAMRCCVAPDVRQSWFGFRSCFSVE